MNDELSAAWRALPADEVRRRAGEVPGELRGYLTVVPETRWVKHPVFGPHFEEELLDHYADHVADLRRDPRGGRMSTGSLKAFVLENTDALDDLAELATRGDTVEVVMLEVVAVRRARRARGAPAPGGRRRRDPHARRRRRRRAAVAGSGSRPPDLDGFARDRALAWLESAIGIRGRRATAAD